jgi:iron(III) transport system permease protein
MIDGTISLENYVKFFSSQVYIRSLNNSILIATLSTIIIAPVGLFIVTETRKYDSTKKIVKILTSLPLVFPSFIFCVSLIYIYGNTGMLNHILSIIGLSFSTSLYSITGIIFANILFFLPYFIIPLFSSFEELNPVLEEAAESLGSNGFHKFRKVIFPQVFHGFLTGVLITFLLIFNQISVIIALGAGRVYTLTYQLFTQYEGFQFEMANTIATISIIITFTVAIIFHIILRRLWKK